MGMTALCSGGCGYSAPSDTHRGGRLGNCPECGTPMRGHTAGQAKGRYLCPITGYVFTFGMRNTCQLDEPMRLVFIPGWDYALPGSGQDRYHRTEPAMYEQKKLDRMAGRVLGPGCVISGDYRPREPGDMGYGKADICLVPAPDADPAMWFVNERLIYKKCRGCGAQVIANDDTHLMTTEWVPKRERYSHSGWRGTRPVDMGPHKAGTYGCRACREGEQW